MPRSEDVATTAVGIGGVGGAAALRHHALELAYEGKPRPNLPIVNLPLLHERKLLTPGVRGRGVYLTGAALGAVSAPVAAVGVNRMVTRKPRRRPREDASKRDDERSRSEKIMQGGAKTALAGAGVGAAAHVAGGHRQVRNIVQAHREVSSQIDEADRWVNDLENHPDRLGHAIIWNANRKRTKAVLHGEQFLRNVRRAPMGSAALLGTGAALAGAGTTYAALPFAAHQATKRRRQRATELAAKRDDRQKPTFFEQGLGGAKEAVVERARTATNPAPPELVAGNYLAGLGIASTAGGLAHLAMRKAPIPGHGKAAIAAAAGTTAGALSLPAQSALTGRMSRGQYEVTPTGVRRAKKKRKPASSRASIHEGRARMGGDSRRFREETVPGGVTKRNSRGQSATHGSRVAKAEKQLTTKERRRLAHQKQVSAALSMTAGSAGLAALGITLAQKHPKVKPYKQHLPALLATGAGVGGANAFLGAHVQQKEAKQQLAPLPRRTVVIVKPDEEAAKRDGDGRRRLRNAGVGAAVGAGVGGAALPYALFGGAGSELRRKSETPDRDYPSKKQFRAGFNPRNVGRDIRDFARVPAGKKALAVIAGVGGVLGVAPGATVGALKPLKRKDEEASKAFGIRLRPTGFRRAPAMRAGTIRQTRYPGGKIRVSTVRGGLA